jgi:hypothetical protein
MKKKTQLPPVRKSALAMSLAILLVMLVGCNLPNRLAATATPLPTATLPPALNTLTSIPPTLTPAPSLTPLPAATFTPAPINIVFSAGTTAAVESGTIQPGQVQAYTLSAGQNQPMILILDSPNNDVYLGVSEPNGNVLLDPAKKWTDFQWLLPKTEAYTIQVYGGKTAQDYTLTTKVAQRITFPSGSSSLTLNGSTPKGYVFSYALACQKNQAMTVNLTVSAATVYLDIFGLATGTLFSSAAQAITWSGSLPATQDYIIEVIPNGQVINYTLKVTVK